MSFDGAAPATVDAMSSPIFRFLRVTGLSAVAAIIYGLIRSTRREPTPPPSGTATWDPLAGETPPPSRSGPVQFTHQPDAAADDRSTETSDETATAPQGFAGVATEPATDTATGWVEPDADGGCPGSHPIKGNDQSKIFHVPGGMSYVRTKAERCYCDEASAEADGYRKAKR